MNYYVKIDHQEIPVTEEIFRTWKKGERKERYFREGDIQNGVFSYDALDGEGLNGCELFADPSIPPVESAVERKLLKSGLKQAISTLNSDEKELLLRIYYKEESLRHISADLHVPFTTLQYRHKKILKKLKNYFEQTFFMSV